MRISIARKNLFHEKLRFVISLGGVAFAVMLILVLLGLYRGWNERLTRYVEGVDADVWVLQRGAGDMFHSTSLFSNDIAERLRGVSGVKQVDLLLGRQISFEVNGKEAHTIIMGYNTATGIGKPLQVVAGASVPASGEIIVDAVFANNKNLGVGDTLKILERDFRVAGIATGGNLVSFQYSYMPIADARQLLQMDTTSNYALLSFSDGATQDEIISRIEEQIPEIYVLTKKEFGDNNKGQITETFLPIIYVLVVIGFVVGLVVISLTIYTATIEKSREYGVVKALGARHSHLYRIIFEQAVITGVIGYLLGVGLTYLVTNIAARYEPAFVTAVAWQDMALVFGIVLVMILGAAYIPIRRILSIDPAIVFKS